MISGWHVVRDNCNDGAFSIEDEEGITICELAFTSGDEEQIARLICAAPLLYNACKAYDISSHVCRWIEKAVVSRQPRDK